MYIGIIAYVYISGGPNYAGNILKNW